jgi:hypothetical protein
MSTLATLLRMKPSSELVYRHARGLGEGLIKTATAVNELLTVADRERSVIEGALQLAREKAEAEAQDGGRDAPTDSDAPSAEAPALLAVRLLDQALEELENS